MELNRNRVRFLKDMVVDCPGEPIKYYVYKLNNSSVIKHKCKMEFGFEFTKAYLRRYLPSTNDTIEVTVSSPEHNKEYLVNMKLGFGTKKGIITSGWYRVVKRYRLVESEIAIFTFYTCREGRLHLSIMHLWSDA